ncbi:lysozyme [Cohnella sp. GbtcB17]|uniref:lysozyme n=1 Tax=Cohnella sp. GbtcB17 TaxID=2824762 RepID=UPI001C30CBBC|nr:lysozyme [Cohnella sp. GbtcB17]
MGYKISQAGIELIKSFEGCRLTAYKPVPTEPYWTIGWGHYGPDVKQGMTISQAQADAIFLQDIARYEKPVNELNLQLNQNQYDALVSFCYNCGAGNLRKLCLGRTISQIAASLPEYNKGGGKVLPGLVRRRAAELELFNKPDAVSAPQPAGAAVVPKIVRLTGNEVITTGEIVDGRLVAPIADVLKAAGVPFTYDNETKKLYLL